MHLNRTALVPTGVPVQPDAEEARQLLSDELAKGIYREAEPSLLEQVWTAVLNWLGEVLGSIRSVDADLGTVLLAVGTAVVIAVAVLLVKPRLNARRKQEPQVFHAASRLSADGHRDRAEAAAANGQWDDALTERFRAITRAAEERVILDEQPGRTALEVSHQLQGRFGPLSEQLQWLANRFNEVHYGARPAVRGDYERAARLDGELQQTRPHASNRSEHWTAPV